MAIVVFGKWHEVFLFTAFLDVVAKFTASSFYFKSRAKEVR